jgi:predicted sulfurtransferase
VLLSEGFNGTISGLPDNVRAFAAELRRFDSHFDKTDFKCLDGMPVEKAFKELTVYPVQELVHYGLAPDDRSFTTLPASAHLDATKYHAKLQEKDTVVIDVRNV